MGCYKKNKKSVKLGIFMIPEFLEHRKKCLKYKVRGLKVCIHEEGVSADSGTHVH